ncbi:NO-inducible flavohemoprotein [Chitinophaga pendula]|uniref:NO-inducible flavohemoprotein n=1 Tax=Chitinophaga TaxID=79328 RepID=UPI000BAFDECB|nr:MULTISPECIES: NO-inducible flavohemoprotein [Chitinophaga]ASZ12580.1 NO-inducible flavohemoprotein [Chitinophaga sp. MD30]UCJ09816.1 NO-inducible flavohemoprotein [Chitinophaga pendula]
MTDEQKRLVAATVPVLREHGVLLTTHFYNRMFTHNPELRHVFNMGNQQKGKQQTALAMAVLAYAEHIENPCSLMPVIDSIGHKHTSLNVRPEHYAMVGKHLLASISEVLGKAATPELVEAWKMAYQKLAAIMSGHEQHLYAMQVSKNAGWTGWKPFVVKRKVEESAEITSFYLYPADGGAVADFLPGQYISLRLFLPELQLLQPRQYSISCAPNGEYYRISVKREAGATYPDGMISNRLHDHIREGDVVDLSAPAGTFTLNPNKTRPKVFISGGVGQTPLMAMLEALTSQRTDVSITWIHGCRNEAVHAFRDRLTQLAGAHPNLDPHIFYDQPTAPAQYKGWVDLSVLKAKILQENADYYLCGPAPFITRHHTFLVENGVNTGAIHFEEFGPASLQLGN